MANEQNLIPLNQRSKEEAKKIQSEGGKAAGAARRRKRSLREAADIYLSLPVADQRAWNSISAAGVDPSDIDNQMAMIIGLTMRATAGDARAGRLIVDILGDDLRDDESGRENNLLEAIAQSGEEIGTDDLPEVQ